MFKKAIVFMLAILVTKLGYAEGICNEKSEILPWKMVLEKKQVDFETVVSAVPKSLQPLIRTLNSLPLSTSEADVLKIVNFEPEKIIRIVDYAPSIRWKIPSDNTVLSLKVYIYKGCINSIDVADLKHPLTLYTRMTKM